MLFLMIRTILINPTSDKIWSCLFLVACSLIFSCLHYPQCFTASKGRLSSCFKVYYRKRCSRALFFQLVQRSHLLILIRHFYKSSFMIYFCHMIFFLHKIRLFPRDFCFSFHLNFTFNIFLTFL